MFNFQNPGPRGFECVLKDSVISEWLVLYPGNMSVSVTFVPTVLLTRKKVQAALDIGLLPAPSKPLKLGVLCSQNVY